MDTTKNFPTNIRAAAIFYVSKMKWPVVPLFGIEDGKCNCAKGKDCERAGKHPTIADWPTKAARTVADVHRLFPPGVVRNVSVVTGAVSGLTVFDIDPPNGMASLRKLTKLAPHPITVRSTTGRGSHRFFAYNSSVRATQSKTFGAGIDIRNDGGLVVVPPSLHLSGKQYTWAEGRSPQQLKPKVIPAAWLKSPSAKAMPTVVPSPPTAPAPDQPAFHVEGGRNTAVTSHAGRLVAAGLKAEDVAVALQEYNKANCNPPLDNAEVQRIAASISRYPAPKSPDEAEAFAHVVLDEHFAGGRHLVLGPDGMLWAFKGTQWSPIIDEWLDKIILESASRAMPPPTMSRTLLKNQVRGLIRAKSAVEGDPLRFNADPLPVINVLNGELWIKDDGSVELRPHDANSYQRHTMKVVYDPKATCPLYDRAVNEIFGESDDPSAFVDLWHEISGYVLQERRPTAVIVIGKGSGSNGKTQLALTIAQLLGHELVVASPVHELEKHRFGTANLLGKRLLLDDDVKTGTRLPDGPLKKISEQKMMSAERKFGSHFTFMSRVLPMLLCNNPPSIADLSPGLRRRMMVIEFDQSFEGERADRTLFSRIWSSEMSGVLNRFLAGLQRLMQRDWHFAPPPAVERALNEFIRAANPLPEYLDAKCDKGAKKSVLVADLYVDFTGWAEANGITFKQQASAFRKNLEHLGYTILKRKAGNTVIGLSIVIS